MIYYNMILDCAEQWQVENSFHIWNSQKTQHTLPSRASYAVSFVGILEKVIML